MIAFNNWTGEINIKLIDTFYGINTPLKYQMPRVFISQPQWEQGWVFIR
jgi:hypothetical protein